MKIKSTYVSLFLLMSFFSGFSQVSEVNFNNQLIDYSLLPRTGISPMSLRLLDSYSNGGPSEFGTVLEIYGKPGHQTSQLHFGGWDNSKIRYRESFYGQNSWNSWITMLDSKNDVESAGNLKITGTANSYILNGNLGIGTTNPQAKLDLFSAAAINGPMLSIRSDFTGIGKYAMIRFGDQSQTSLYQKGAIIYEGLAVSAKGRFHIALNDDDTSNSVTLTDAKLTVLCNGNVGIGTIVPTAKLEVQGMIKSYVPALLGTTLNNFQLLNERAGNVGNNSVYNRLWTLRDGGTNDWFTARLHDGISVDASFATPHIDTRTWWERDPKDNIQSWGNAGDTYLTINNGKVGIGTQNPDKELTVNGTIHSKEVIVDINIFPDYVFQKYYTGKSELKSDYVMPTLAEIESFTKKNNHLPNIPSAKEMQAKGMSLGEMNNLLLQKVEELTLYAIEQENKLKEQNQTIEAQSKILETLADRLTNLERKQ